MVLAHQLNLLERSSGTLARAIAVVLNSGWLGVQLFFVLSGFLITGILIDTRDSKNYWRSFLGRRVLRIFPLYYAVLFAAFVVAPLLGHAPEGAQHQIWLWTYVGNFAKSFGRSVPVLPHFWSLSVEEQFYLLWPLIVHRLPLRGLVIVCIALAVGALASRLLIRPTVLGPEAVYAFTMCRVDALALGALAAVAARDPRLRATLTARRAFLRVIAVSLCLVMFVVTRGAGRVGFTMQIFGYSAYAIAFALIIVDVALAAASDRFVRMLSLAPLRAVGRYSYAMYVFHHPLHTLIGLPLVARIIGLREPGIAFALTYLCLGGLAVFVAGVLAFHIFEKHFLTLKRHFEARSA
jgi:peptidoglycan/LPS O-acetylase OafA/YrhL